MFISIHPKMLTPKWRPSLLRGPRDPDGKSRQSVILKLFTPIARRMKLLPSIHVSSDIHPDILKTYGFLAVNVWRFT